MKDDTASWLPTWTFALAVGGLLGCSGTSQGGGATEVGTSVKGDGGAGTASSSGTTTHSGIASSGSASSGSASRGSATRGASATDGGSGNTGDPEPPGMVGMTAAHNSARAAVNPPATPPLPPMAWSSSVAASAQAFTESCVFADTSGPYGSNAFAGSGSYTPAEVVASWVSEDSSYDYAANTCKIGEECGHYTQVVWRDSVGLGCGMTNCTKHNPFTLSGSGAWQLWVCNYDPPGNYVGTKPY